MSLKDTCMSGMSSVGGRTHGVVVEQCDKQMDRVMDWEG